MSVSSYKHCSARQTGECMASCTLTWDTGNANAVATDIHMHINVKKRIFLTCLQCSMSQMRIGNLGFKSTHKFLSKEKRTNNEMWKTIETEDSFARLGFPSYSYAARCLISQPPCISHSHKNSELWLRSFKPAVPMRTAGCAMSMRRHVPLLGIVPNLQCSYLSHC